MTATRDIEIKYTYSVAYRIQALRCAKQLRVASVQVFQLEYDMSWFFVTTSSGWGQTESFVSVQ